MAETILRKFREEKTGNAPTPKMPQASPASTGRMKLSDFEVLRTLGTGSFGRVKFTKSRIDGLYYAVKSMKKHDIIKLKQVDHINSERSIMMQLNHPFIVNMRSSFKDDRYIYIVMECVAGGELFTHLRRARRFSDEQAKFYAAQIAAVFQYMHGKNIAHRDLKPENILITKDGYCKLTDFGFAKVIPPGERTFTLCGTPEYLCPEILLNKGHSCSVDWYTLGILIYEMIVGNPPFVDDEPMRIYQKILAGDVSYPKSIDKHAKALIKNLIVADLSKRYGNLKGGADDVIKCKWFSTISFDKLYAQLIPAPFKPEMTDERDVSNFEEINEDDDISPPPVASAEDPFVDW
jgi:serine/threonine protein kinase